MTESLAMENCFSFGIFRDLPSCGYCIVRDFVDARRELMPASPVIDLKTFVPAKDAELSKRFYIDLGFTIN